MQNYVQRVGFVFCAGALPGAGRPWLVSLGPKLDAKQKSW